MKQSEFARMTGAAALLCWFAMAASLIGSVLLRRSGHDVVGSALLAFVWLFGVLFVLCVLIRLAMVLSILPGRLKARLAQRN